jgi:hypothetical protein
MGEWGRGQCSLQWMPRSIKSVEPFLFKSHMIGATSYLVLKRPENVINNSVIGSSLYLDL